MKWVTITDADTCRTAFEALECCRLHWTQILTATKTQVIGYRGEHMHSLLASGLCGLCAYHKDRCTFCAIYKAGYGCCLDDSPYDRASKALTELQNRRMGIRKFRKLCRPMLRVIEELCKDS